MASQFRGYLPQQNTSQSPITNTNWFDCMPLKKLYTDKKGVKMPPATKTHQQLAVPFQNTVTMPYFKHMHKCNLNVHVLVNSCTQGMTNSTIVREKERERARDKHRGEERGGMERLIFSRETSWVMDKAETVAGWYRDRYFTHIFSLLNIDISGIPLCY